MPAHRYEAFISTVAVLALAACNANDGIRSFAPAAASVAAERSNRSSILGNGQALYVANNQAVTVYGSGGRLLRSVIQGIGAPNSVALDASGHAYVANQSANTVTVYDRRGKSLVRTISRNLVQPVRLILDSHNNLYVIRQNAVNIYSDGRSHVMHSIKVAAYSLAVDSADDLYVGTTSNAVNVYAPGSEKPMRTITAGVDHPAALAFDGAGNLYVGNDQPGCGSVTVYAPGSNSVLRTITQSVCGPAALSFDDGGNLYVANAAQMQQIGNSVTVYLPGTDTPWRIVKQGIGTPRALAFDSSGNLYVDNLSYSQVTVYAPGKTSIMQVILKGINYPVSIAIGR